MRLNLLVLIKGVIWLSLIDSRNLPTVRIASDDNVKLGEWVREVIGSPFGFNQTVTAGIVSGKQRKLAGDNYVPYTVLQLIQVILAALCLIYLAR